MIATRSVSRRLEDTADKLARAACRERGECELKGIDGHVCGGRSLHWAHIVGRDEKVIRHDPANCLLLCEDGHEFYTHRPREFEAMVNERWPRRLAALFVARRVLSGGGLDQIDRLHEWIAYYRGGSLPSCAVKWQDSGAVGLPNEGER